MWVEKLLAAMSGARNKTEESEIATIEDSVTKTVSETKSVSESQLKTKTRSTFVYYSTPDGLIKEIHNPKTQAGVRDIPLTQKAVEVLKEQRKQFVRVDEEFGKWLFEDEKTNENDNLDHLAEYLGFKKPEKK